MQQSFEVKKKRTVADKSPGIMQRTTNIFFPPFPGEQQHLSRVFSLKTLATSN